MGRALAGMRRSSKLEFLQHVVDRTRSRKHGPSPLMAGDDYARDHVLMICESLQLRLTRLYRDPEGYGYEIRITRAGRYLAAGRIDEAAATLDSGTILTRLDGDPPDGVLGTLLAPGSPGISLFGMAARQHAPEMMRGVATGHLVVIGGVIRSAQNAGSPGGGRGRSAIGWSQEQITALPSSRAARHIGIHKS